MGAILVVVAPVLQRRVEIPTPDEANVTEVCEHVRVALAGVGVILTVGFVFTVTA